MTSEATVGTASRRTEVGWADPRAAQCPGAVLIAQRRSDRTRSVGTEDLITALNQRPSAIGYYLGQRLASLFPGKAIFEGMTPAFNVEAWARADLCSLIE